MTATVASPGRALQDSHLRQSDVSGNDSWFELFLGVVSASIARRNFLRYREQYSNVRERFAGNFNAASGVPTASKNGGHSEAVES